MDKTFIIPDVIPARVTRGKDQGNHLGLLGGYRFDDVKRIVYVN